MIGRIRQKIEHLRQQPEEVRLRTAVRYTIIGGIIISALWLFIFLPLQIQSLFS